MKIVVIGTGGVGGYFGGRLALAEHHVTFIARGKHLDAIKRNGLVVKSINGDFKIENPKASDTLSDIETPELIILALKAWQVKEMAKQIIPIIGNNTIVLPLQNGVMAYNEITESIPKQHVLGGLCRIISKIESPGVINHFAVNPEIVFGEYSGGLSDRVEDLKHIFKSATINAKASDNIQADLWKKFISICISGLLAVSNSTYGQVCEVPETHELMVDLFKEIYTLSQKEGIDIDPDFIQRTVKFIESFPYNSTSSLTRDVWDGKPSEIEYQNGTVVKLARKHKLDVPINKMIYHCILPQEIRARIKQ